MNHVSLTIRIEDLQTLHEIIKAAKPSKLDEVQIFAQGRESIPTESGEMFEPGHITFSFGKVEYRIDEVNEENLS